MKKKKRGGRNKDIRGMNQVKKRKKNKSVRKDVMLLRDETFIFSNHVQSATRTSSVPCSHNFLLPLLMSTILNLLILDIPTYG
jgi:hypothetical protein